MQKHLEKNGKAEGIPLLRLIWKWGWEQNAGAQEKGRMGSGGQGKGGVGGAVSAGAWRDRERGQRFTVGSGGITRFTDVIS